MPAFRPMPGYRLGTGWTPQPRPRSRAAAVWQWVGPVVSLVATVGACLLLLGYAQVADQVEWECAVSTCGTDDPRSLAPIASWALVVLAALGTLRLPGRGWWTAGLLAAFGVVAAWAVDWWHRPGTDLALVVTPIAAWAVAAGFLTVQVALLSARASRR
uniref:Uncharacterized protein n=1 Tax=Neobacillus citreus TaxID=2833578 RepID=A0A942Y8Y7_9BACI